MSHAIHADPEIRFEEVRASARLADALEARGFTVTRGVAGLPTAFRAERRGGAGDGPTVALLCEYDALPGLGHACGHNLIATMGAGAAFALGGVIDELPGTLVVLGTPAEEGGGGKALMIDGGAFEGVDAALMIHPFHLDQASMPTLASSKWDVSFRGVPAHAAMAPHLGRNALDAVRLAFAGVDALRQQVRDDVRMHAIVTDGGAAANIIPERAAMLMVARSADSHYLEHDLMPRLRNVFEGAALMTGTSVVITASSPTYREILPNAPLEDAFERHARRRGRSVTPYDPHARSGSTDLGNVSQVLPALHGMLAIDDAALPHTEAFARAARSARGDATLLDGASVLAAIAAELLTDRRLLERARSAFERASAPRAAA